MKNKNTSYHEIINQQHMNKHKLYFDIDASDDEHDIYNIIYTLKTVCRTLGYSMVDFYYIKNSHKNAYHIYSKTTSSQQMNKLIAEKSNEILGYTCFDLMIYRPNSSLRLPLTPKITA